MRSITILVDDAFMPNSLRLGFGFALLLHGLLRLHQLSCSCMREGKVLILEHTFGRLDPFFVCLAITSLVILDPMDKCSSYLVHTPIIAH